MKNSGASSVESLMETLYILKVKQQELEAQCQSLRNIINEKELIIQDKEEEKQNIK